MASAVWLVIFGMIFYFFQHMYQKVVLKKSDDEIRLDDLSKEAQDLILNPGMFKSKKKIDKKIEDIVKEMDILENKIKISKQRHNN